MIIESRLGNNPVHRMRNRIAAEILEPRWKENFEKNRDAIGKSLRFDDLKCQPVAAVIGAGPSLRDNLGEMGLLGKTTFFCTDKAYPRIYHKRVPEYVCAINAQSPDEECSNWWSSCDTSLSTLILPITADPVHLEGWKGPYCLVNQSLPVDLSDRIADETGLEPLPGGSNVGVFSYMMAVRAGARAVMLLGMDYSFETREEVLSKYGPKEPYIIFEHRDEVGRVRWASWDWFDSAIAFFEYARFFAKNGVRTFNCTEGGIIYDGECIHPLPLSETVRELNL